MKLLLDVDVVIGALDGSDAHHQAARDLLAGAREREDSLLISVVNLSEVLIALAADAAKLTKARQAIAALGIATRQLSDTTGVDAARLRGRHPISLPDAFLLASAKRISATIASFDEQSTEPPSVSASPRFSRSIPEPRVPNHEAASVSAACGAPQRECCFRSGATRSRSRLTAQLRPEQRRRGRSHEMTRYLISFDHGAMDHIPDQEGRAVGEAAHAVVQEARDAGVSVFAGGCSEEVSEIMPDPAVGD